MNSWFDDWYMAIYNVTVLSLPPLAVAFWDQDLSEEKIGHYPEIYPELREGIYLTNYTFTRWCVSALYHSLLVFFGFWLLPTVIRGNGQDAGQWVISTLVGVSGCYTLLVRGMVSTRSFSWPIHAANLLSVIAPIAFFLIEGHILSLFPKFYYVMDTVMTTGAFYIYAIFVIVAGNVPEVAFEYLMRQTRPQLWQIVQEVDVIPPERIALAPENAAHDDSDQTQLDDETDAEQLKEGKKKKKKPKLVKGGSDDGGEGVLAIDI